MQIEIPGNDCGVRKPDTGAVAAVNAHHSCVPALGPGVALPMTDLRSRLQEPSGACRHEHNPVVTRPRRLPVVGRVCAGSPAHPERGARSHERSRPALRGGRRARGRGALCRRAGLHRRWPARLLVVRGRLQYCVGRPGLFRQGGVARVDLFVVDARNAARRVYSDQLIAYRVLAGKPAKVQIARQGAACGAGSDARTQCAAQLAWNGHGFGEAIAVSDAKAPAEARLQSAAARPRRAVGRSRGGRGRAAGSAPAPLVVPAGGAFAFPGRLPPGLCVAQRRRRALGR